MTATNPIDEALGDELNRILQARAERVRAVAAAEQAESTVSVAQFAFGADLYAIPLDALRAVIPLQGVTPVPLAPAHVLGIVRFQGQLITAMSLMALLGVKGWRQDSAVLVVLQPESGRLVAVDCEQVPRIEALPARALEAACARGGGPVYEVAGAGLHPVGFIDVSALFAQHTGDASHG